MKRWTRPSYLILASYAAEPEQELRFCQVPAIATALHKKPQQQRTTNLSLQLALSSISAQAEQKSCLLNGHGPPDCSLSSLGRVKAIWQRVVGKNCYLALRVGSGSRFYSSAEITWHLWWRQEEVRNAIRTWQGHGEPEPPSYGCEKDAGADVHDSQRCSGKRNPVGHRDRRVFAAWENALCCALMVQKEWAKKKE